MAALLPRFEIRYFPLLAKGLGPALVAEHSGLPWSGSETLGFSIERDWATLKPRTPFGQLPLLTVVDSGASVAQSTAIVNVIARMAGTAGACDDDFAMSQQLLAEGEDLYALLDRHVPTVYKRLSDAANGVRTTKGTAAEYARLWRDLLPPHIARLARLLEQSSPASEPPSFAREGGGRFLPGELYLFAMVYQATLVESTVLDGHDDLGAWFRGVRAAAATETVLSGRSAMGPLHQYFQAIDSPDVCKIDDEREEEGP